LPDSCGKGRGGKGEERTAQHRSHDIVRYRPRRSPGRPIGVAFPMGAAAVTSFEIVLRMCRFKQAIVALPPLSGSELS
jgi:hypothetical protein